MKRSTLEMVVFMALGVGILTVVVVVPQVRARRTMALQNEIREANRFNGPPPGMQYLTAGPVIRGDDEKSLARKAEQGYTAMGPISPAESPQRRVFVKPFFIDTYEVTNKAFRAAVEEGHVLPPSSPGSSTHEDYFINPEFDEYPVVNLTWDQARAYCECQGKRLPTEAEWERAARGLDDRFWPWGDDWEPQNANSAEADRRDVAKRKAYPKDVSPARVFHMAGNVREFVADWFAEEAYQSDSVYAPMGPPEGNRRVVRGGSWADSAWALRTGRREAISPEAFNNYTGFRCARDFVPDWRATLDQVLEAATTQPALRRDIDAAKGRLLVDLPAFDYGDIWVGDEVNHTFTLRNTGEGDLEIRGVRTSCGCTTVGEGSATIPPGGSWDLTVKINTEKGRRGLLTRSVHLVTDDPYAAYLDLYLYGIIRDYLEVIPSPRVSFGEMNHLKDLERKVRLVNNLDVPMQLTGIDLGVSGKTWLDASTEPVVEGKTYDLVVRAKGGLDVRPYESLITVNTNLEKAPSINVQVTGTIVPRVAVRPKVLSIEQPVTILKRRVALVVNEGDPVRITSATVTDPSIKVEISESAGESYVEIYLDKASTIAEEGYELVITTDDEEFREFKIPIFRRPNASRPNPVPEQG